MIADKIKYGSKDYLKILNLNISLYIDGFIQLRIDVIMNLVSYGLSSYGSLSLYGSYLVFRSFHNINYTRFNL